MRAIGFGVAMLALAAQLSAATKVLVTVIDQRTGSPVTDLRATDFTVLDDKTPHKVEAAEFKHATLDIMLLLDTSVVGEMVQSLAASFVEELQPKEQMAVVAFHNSADLIQDFTSSKELLLRSIAKVKYGNEPHVLDALYASADGGFQPGGFRRVILLVTAGMEGASRVSERSVVKAARRNQVSIFPVYATGRERSMFELLAKQTGGACFNARDMRKTGGNHAGARVFEALRGHYVLTVASGNLGLGEHLKVEVKRGDKLITSALPLE